MSELAHRLATDGRMIVEEVDGNSFWKGQSYIADCVVSASYRPTGSVEAHAKALVARYNAHEELRSALDLALHALIIVAEDAGDVDFWNKRGKGYLAAKAAREALAKT